MKQKLRETDSEIVVNEMYQNGFTILPNLWKWKKKNKR